MSPSSSPTRRPHPHRTSSTPIIAGSLVGFIVVVAIVATFFLVNQRQKRLRNQRLTYHDESLKSTPQNTPLVDKDPSHTCGPLQEDSPSPAIPRSPLPSMPRNSKRILQHISQQHHHHSPSESSRSHSRSYGEQMLKLHTSDKPHIPIISQQQTLLRHMPHALSNAIAPEGTGAPGTNNVGQTGSTVLQESKKESKRESNNPNGLITSSPT